MWIVEWKRKHGRKILTSTFDTEEEANKFKNILESINARFISLVEF